MASNDHRHVTAPALRLDARPVEDVRAPAVSSPSSARPASGKYPNHGRERRAQLRMDEAGAPCACDDRTPCLAHAALTGRRRWLRPKNRRGGGRADRTERRPQVEMV
jgi:hypothetical protein